MVIAVLFHSWLLASLHSADLPHCPKCHRPTGSRLDYDGWLWNNMGDEIASATVGQSRLDGHLMIKGAIIMANQVCMLCHACVDPHFCCASCWRTAELT